MSRGRPFAEGRWRGERIAPQPRKSAVGSPGRPAGAFAGSALVGEQAPASPPSRDRRVRARPPTLERLADRQRPIGDAGPWALNTACPTADRDSAWQAFVLADEDLHRSTCRASRYLLPAALARPRMDVVLEVDSRPAVDIAGRHDVAGRRFDAGAGDDGAAGRPFSVTVPVDLHSPNQAR